MPSPRVPECATCGAGCILRPMPWPPKSRTTVQPSARASSSIAAPMSPSRAPSRTAAMPASRQRRATLDDVPRLGRRLADHEGRRGVAVVAVELGGRRRRSRCRRGRAAPARKGCRGRRPRSGSCTPRPESRGSRADWAWPPRRLVSSRTSWSMSAVLIPGRSCAPTKARVSAATRPASTQLLSLVGGMNDDGHALGLRGAQALPPIPF